MDKLIEYIEEVSGWDCREDRKGYMIFSIAGPGDDDIEIKIKKGENVEAMVKNLKSYAESFQPWDEHVEEWEDGEVGVLSEEQDNLEQTAEMIDDLASCVESFYEEHIKEDYIEDGQVIDQAFLDEIENSEEYQQAQREHKALDAVIQESEEKKRTVGKVLGHSQEDIKKLSGDKLIQSCQRTRKFVKEHKEEIKQHYKNKRNEER